MQENQTNETGQGSEEKYSYTYRALTPSERREAEGILREYEPESGVESDFEKLNRLERRVRIVAEIVGLTLGVAGILVFGGGMSACLLNPDNVGLFAIGCILGGAGAALCALAYPIYRYTLKKRKEKYGDEIRRLCKKVLGKEEQTTD
ncbi:MAG: hypothetical protein IJX98_07465 [Clostridia bacterium]|nr:hypothetical protein [Clostridia bacterium]